MGGIQSGASQISRIEKTGQDTAFPHGRLRATELRGIKMKIQKPLVIIAIVGIVGFAGQAIASQFTASSQNSSNLNPKLILIENFPSQGDSQLIEQLKVRTIQLLEARVTLSNVDQETAQRTDLLVAKDVRSRVQDLVEQVWSKERLNSATQDILEGWNLGKEDPNYEPFNSAVYLLDSWQGVQVSPDGTSARAVVTGRMKFVYSDKTSGTSEFQDQITMVFQDGEWLLDEASAVYTGRTP
jgi:hypothetical protein